MKTETKRSVFWVTFIISFTLQILMSILNYFKFTKYTEIDLMNMSLITALTFIQYEIYNTQLNNEKHHLYMSEKLIDIEYRNKTLINSIYGKVNEKRENINK